jgi:ABC-type nickel/cobalt efflux system permease component RcnA
VHPLLALDTNNLTDISTTFVDHLHAEPSAPPSLQQSPNLPVSALPLDASPSLLPFLANAPKIIRLRNNVTCVCQNGVCICIPEGPLDPRERAEHSTTHERHHHEHHAHSEHHHEEKRRIGRRRQIVGIFVSSMPCYRRTPRSLIIDGFL